MSEQTRACLLAQNPPLPRFGLTLYPEWIVAIFWLGKNVENRVWKPWSRLIGRRLAFSAGKSWGGQGQSKRAQENAWEAVATTADRAGWTPAIKEDRETGTPILEVTRGQERLAFAGGPVSNEGAIVIQPGCLYGDVILTGHTQSSPSPWAFAGQVHWQISKPRLYPAPIPAIGRQRIWTPRDQINAVKRKQAEQAEKAEVL